MAKHEKVLVALGETVKLSAKDGIKSDDNRLSKDARGRWGSTGSAAVINSEDLEADTIEVTGASIGKCLVFYRQPTALKPEEAIASSLGAGAADAKRQIDDDHAIAFEVEVVAKKDAKGNAVAATSPLANGGKFDGRLPMNESQTEPSEKTPYGMDQQNKPVAPFPGMVSPNDDSTVARQSETAQSNRPGEPASNDAPAGKKAGKKAAKKAATK